MKFLVKTALIFLVSIPYAYPQGCETLARATARKGNMNEFYQIDSCGKSEGRQLIILEMQRFEKKYKKSLRLETKTYVSLVDEIKAAGEKPFVTFKQNEHCLDEFKLVVKLKDYSQSKYGCPSGPDDPLTSIKNILIREIDTTKDLVP